MAAAGKRLVCGAGIALYLGKLQPHEVKAKTGACRQSAQQVCKGLKELSLPDDVGEYRLKRAAGRLAGLSCKEMPNCYSFEERQAAVYNVVTGQMTAPQAQLRFGVPSETLKKDKLALFDVALRSDGGRATSINRINKEARKARFLNKGERKKLQETPIGRAELVAFEETVKAVTDKWRVKGVGGNLQFPADEEALLVSVMAHMADAAAGKSRRAQREYAIGLAKAKAAQLLKGDAQDRARAEKLLTFKASDKWLAAAYKRTCERGVRLATKKPAALSQNRAAANVPYLNAAMHKKIRAYYDEVLGKGVEPDADQVWNGDEVGFDPNGKWGKVLCFKGERGERRGGVSRIQTGERAPFWVTMFFVTRADGQCFVPPMIIHQGAHTNIGHVLDLPSDWPVGSTPSGYMDQENFLPLAKHLVDYMTMGGKVTKPQFLFLDGHESHFNASALKYMKDKNVHVFFLKSGDSENDQVSWRGVCCVCGVCCGYTTYSVYSVRSRERKVNGVNTVLLCLFIAPRC